MCGKAKLGTFMFNCLVNNIFVFIFRHISADMLKKLFPLPAKKDDENLLVMVCGPPGFMKLLSGEKTKDLKQVLIIDY